MIGTNGGQYVEGTLVVFEFLVDCNLRLLNGRIDKQNYTKVPLKENQW